MARGGWYSWEEGKGCVIQSALGDELGEIWENEA